MGRESGAVAGARSVLAAFSTKLPAAAFLKNVFSTAIYRFRQAQSEWQKLGTTDCTSLRQGAVDGRHVIEALKIICGRMALTLKAGECTYRESFVVF